MRGASDRGMVLQAADAKALISESAQHEGKEAWRDDWQGVLDCSASCLHRFEGDDEKHGACYRNECGNLEKTAKAETVMLPVAPPAEVSKLDVAPRGGKAQFSLGTRHSGLLRASAEEAAASEDAQSEHDSIPEDWHKLLACSKSCKDRFDGDGPKHAACYRAECKTLERVAEAEVVVSPGETVSNAMAPPKKVKY